jgi:hypothetical protein
MDCSLIVITLLSSCRLSEFFTSFCQPESRLQGP